jgi:hypothetical protein
MGLAGALLLVAGIQASAAAPADAMIRQEKHEEDCEFAGGTWIPDWGCFVFGDDSGGDGGGGGGGGGPTGGGGSGDDGTGGGGGGFGSGGDNPGSPDGSWDSPGDDGLKDPLDPGCFEIQGDGGVYEICPVGPPPDMEEPGVDDESVWDPETDRPRGPVVAMQGKRHSAQGRAAARKARLARQARAARAHHR